MLKSAKGKIIVVEDENPIMVITPYEEENLQGQSRSSFAPSTSLGASSFAKATEDKSEGELTLDDLPL